MCIYPRTSRRSLNLSAAHTADAREAARLARRALTPSLHARTSDRQELKPISKSHTDSLVELGAASPTRAGYYGVALTLIDSLDTLAMLGNVSEFVWAVRWIGENVSFDLDVEVRASCTSGRQVAAISRV